MPFETFPGLTRKRNRYVYIRVDRTYALLYRCFALEALDARTATSVERWDSSKSKLGMTMIKDDSLGDRVRDYRRGLIEFNFRSSMSRKEMGSVT